MLKYLSPLKLGSAEKIRGIKKTKALKSHVRKALKSCPNSLERCKYF